MDFNTQLKNDVNDVFLQEFSQIAVYKSKTELKEVTVQFFERSLDQLDTIYQHVWASNDTLNNVSREDTLELDGVVYGIVDIAPDDVGGGVNLFLQKV